MTATEWIQNLIAEFPHAKFLVERCKELGDSDEDIKDFLEGL